ENAIDRAGLNAQRAEHALAVVDRKAGDLKALARGHTLFADVNAVDRARFRALIAGDAGRQIVAMETAVPGGNRHRQFRIFELLSERFSLGPVRDQPIAERDPHTVSNGRNGIPDIAKPTAHRRSRSE